LSVSTAGADPEVGQLVRVRGQQWVVAGVSRSSQPRDELSPTVLPGCSIVRLTSVSDDDLGDELSVVWDVEPGREILPATSLPTVTPGGWDEPERFGAFLDAVRWGTVASADERTLQAPFRSGISIQTHQLAPATGRAKLPTLRRVAVKVS